MQTAKMQYNECKICGANNGRAGILIGNEVLKLSYACLNCHDTRTTGEIVIHSNLSRTLDELQKTMRILDNKK